MTQTPPDLSLASDFQQGKGTAGKLITDTALADEAQTLLARANESVSELRSVVTNLNAALKNVRHGTARLPEGVPFTEGFGEVSPVGLYPIARGQPMA